MSLLSYVAGALRRAPLKSISYVKSFGCVTRVIAQFQMCGEKAYDTAYSQAVTHPSTNAAQSCLTSVIGRELVFSTWYGRRHLL